jgi:hypothetical protein
MLSSSLTLVDLIKFQNTGAYFNLGLTNEKYEMNKLGANIFF